jgi:hypothetical protein
VEGVDSPLQVKGLEDGVDDSFHTQHINKTNHGTGAAAHLDKTALDDIGGTQLPPQMRRKRKKARRPAKYEPDSPQAAVSELATYSYPKSPPE